MLKPAIRRERVLTSTLLQVIAAVVGGLVLGLALIAARPAVALLLVAGGFFLGIARKHPELLVLSLIMATSTAIPFEDIPVIMSIGPGRIFVTDLILIIPFSLILLRAISEPDFPLIRTRLDLPLVLFVLMVYVATLLGFIREIPPHMGIAQIFSSPPDVIRLAIAEIRFIAYYLVFFSVTNLVRSEKQLDWLIVGLNMAALIGGLLIILQVALPNVPLVQVGRVEALRTEGVRYSDVTRVADLPGEGLILIMFSVVIANLLHRRPARLSDWLLLAPFGIALLFTFNRNFWVSIGLSTVLLAYLGNKSGVQRFILYVLGGTALVGIVMLIAASAPESQLAHLLQATGDRLKSLVIPDTYTEGASLQDRVVETQYALQQFAARPLFGIGLGGFYRPYDGRIDWEHFDGRGYLHNGHLFLIVKSGLFGYVCFLWLSFVFVARSFRHWRAVKQPHYRAVLLGFATAYVGVAFAALVNPIYMQASWTPVIGVIMGINEVILRLNGVTDTPDTQQRRLWYTYSVKQEHIVSEEREDEHL